MRGGGARAAVGLGAVVLALTQAAPVHCQSLRGRVIDEATGRGIPLPTLTVVDTSGVALAHGTGAVDGWFRLPVPPERRILIHVEALGYLGIVEGPFTLARADSLRVEVVLMAAPVDIEGLTVTATPTDRFLDAVGFERRRRIEGGYHLSGRDLERRGTPRWLADWLRAIPGVRVDNEGGVELRGASSFRGPCPYRVFLDGVLVVTDPTGSERTWARELIAPEDIAAVEVYPRPSTVPTQFGGAQGACGVVLVWSRH